MKAKEQMTKPIINILRGMRGYTAPAKREQNIVKMFLKGTI